jgi:hypothetical protein
MEPLLFSLRIILLVQQLEIEGMRYAFRRVYRVQSQGILQRREMPSAGNTKQSKEPRSLRID